MRVIVAGGREVPITPENLRAVAAKLVQIGATRVLSGCCRGADQLGEAAATQLNLPVDRYPADWGGEGRSAGPIRNRRMAQDAGALLLVLPGGEGSASMRREAVRAGIPVYAIDTRRLDL